MGKKSKAPIDWMTILRRSKIGELRRINRRLFEDLNETEDYLDALSEAIIINQCPGASELLEIVREQFQTLPHARKHETLARIVSQQKHNLIVILMGARPNEIEESVQTFSFLLDLADKDRYMLTERKTNVGIYCIHILMQATGQGSTATWSNVLRHMYRTRDTSFLLRIIEHVGTSIRLNIRILPITHWDDSNKVFESPEPNTLIFTIPVPPDLVEWTANARDRSIERIIETDKGITELATEIKQRVEEFEAKYQTMWLEMMLEPKWGLRDEWLDAATIEIPELVSAGYRIARFQPLEPFPNFRVQFTKERTNGSETVIQIDLEPSDLSMVQNREVPSEIHLLNWVDRLLAFVAVQTVWFITMGKCPAHEKRKGTRATGSQGAIIRPRFQRLPAGHSASEQARARALERFRRAPLPGFTFVREHQRGTEVHSGNPLFSMTTLQK